MATTGKSAKKETMFTASNETWILLNSVGSSSENRRAISEAMLKKMSTETIFLIFIELSLKVSIVLPRILYPGFLSRRTEF